MHQDIDHVGSLASIVKELDRKVEVIAHETEEQYITGEKTPTKLAQFEKNKDSLPVSTYTARGDSLLDRTGIA